jgi:hypothetical protein
VAKEEEAASQQAQELRVQSAVLSQEFSKDLKLVSFPQPFFTYLYMLSHLFCPPTDQLVGEPMHSTSLHWLKCISCTAGKGRSVSHHEGRMPS